MRGWTYIHLRFVRFTKQPVLCFHILRCLRRKFIPHQSVLIGGTSLAGRVKTTDDGPFASPVVTKCTTQEAQQRMLLRRRLEWAYRRKR